jgi:glycosyltransferase involved in cell wall biosynthesis
MAAIVLPLKEGFSDRSVGAIGLLVRRLALASRGFRTVVLGAASNAPTFPGIEYIGIRGSKFAGRPLNWLYARTVARALRGLRPAVVEVHNRPQLATYLARRLPKTPVLLILHNDPQEAHGAQTARQRRRLLDRLARVVVISDWMARRFLDSVGPANRPPALLPNCIDFAELPDPLPDAEREKLILFVGRLVHNKGTDTFVAASGLALRKLPGWRVVAIGANSLSADSAETNFLRGVHEAARGTGIEFAGYRGHADTMAMMARAAIVVMPSRWNEPFGLVALEALANGAALICSPRGALPEVAGDAAVYVDPEDVAALEDAIVALANDPVRRFTMASLGRARARYFAVETAAETLERLRRRSISDAAV